MKAFTLLSSALCGAMAIGAVAAGLSFSTDLVHSEAAMPAPGKIASRQATREQIMARQVAADQGLGKRQFGGGPSAVPT